MFGEERERIFALEEQYPHVHVVRPVASGRFAGLLTAKIWTRSRP